MGEVGDLLPVFCLSSSASSSAATFIHRWSTDRASRAKQTAVFKKCMGPPVSNFPSVSTQRMQVSQARRIDEDSWQA
ncbi:hypothetical protein ACLOJK_005496, partial [Asimina triloba]